MTDKESTEELLREECHRWQSPELPADPVERYKVWDAEQVRFARHFYEMGLRDARNAVAVTPEQLGPNDEQRGLAIQLVGPDYRFLEDVAEAIAARDEARDAARAPRWVPLTERHPPAGVPVVVKDADGCLWLAQFDGGEQGGWDLLEQTQDAGRAWQEAELVKWCALPEDDDGE